jgi:hypothetical protein
MRRKTKSVAINRTLDRMDCTFPPDDQTKTKVTKRSRRTEVTGKSVAQSRVNEASRLPRLAWEMGFEVAENVGVDIGGGTRAFNQTVSAAGVDTHVEVFAQ